MGSRRSVACPHCGTEVPWTTENRYRPFCSERCKLNDLGDWAMERYRVPVQHNQNDSETPDEENR
jgi:endogenous inhibitor of DNA gyrase (YacG/DUF329 family)